MTRAASDGSSREFSIIRVFDAPRELIFKVWTDPRYVALWWGIEGATNPVCELDVRPGGQWRIDMRTASGKVYRNHGVYIEVVENRRLVYSDIPDPYLAEWQGRPPGPNLHTVTFLDQGERTEVTLEVRMNSKADRDRMLALGMLRGIAQGFDRLERLLETIGHVQTQPTEGGDALPVRR